MLPSILCHPSTLLTLLPQIPQKVSLACVLRSVSCRTDAEPHLTWPPHSSPIILCGFYDTGSECYETIIRGLQTHMLIRLMPKKPTLQREFTKATRARVFHPFFTVEHRTWYCGGPGGREIYPSRRTIVRSHGTGALTGEVETPAFWCRLRVFLSAPFDFRGQSLRPQPRRCVLCPCNSSLKASYLLFDYLVFSILIDQKGPPHCNLVTALFCPPNLPARSALSAFPRLYCPLSSSAKKGCCEPMAFGLA